MDTIPNTLQDMLADLITFLPRLIVALLIFVLSLYLAGLLARLIRTALTRRKADQEITLLIHQLTRWGIIILGAFTALQHIGFNVNAFLAGLGILGFTVGFALQDVSKNFVAGVLLLLEQPFDLGDVIEVSGFIGKVGAVEPRATELHTFDGQTVLIPNAEVFTSPIKNYSRYPKRRVDLTVGVAYGSDLAKVRQTVLDVVASIPGVVDDPPPRVVFNNFGASSIDFTVYYWVDIKTGDYLGAIDGAVTQIKAAFEEKGIEIPYPTRTVILEK